MAGAIRSFYGRQPPSGFLLYGVEAARHDFRGIMVYPMFKPGKEFLLGFARDPGLDPFTVIGIPDSRTSGWPQKGAQA